MSIPSNVRMNLDPRDEYTHVPEAFSNYNESMYFHAFDRRQQIGAWMRIGNRVNEGHAEVTLCIYLPDGKVGFMYSRPKITDNKEFAAGGMRFTIVEPFKRIDVSYVGDVLIMADPADMADPGKAFKNNPKVPCSINLQFTGVSPMLGGELVNLDGTPYALDPETATYRGHTEQHVAAEGNITVDGVAYSIDGFGYRDKSWGPRHWQSFYWYKWCPLTFNKDFGIILMQIGQPDGPTTIAGHVFHDGELDPILDADIRAVFDQRFFQTSLDAKITTAKGQFDLHGEVVSLVPLRHRRKLADGSLTEARITEGMTRFTCNGHSAYGMAEFLDLLVGGRPISIDLLGAPQVVLA